MLVFSKAPWLHGRCPASSLLWASPTPCWAAATVMSSLRALAAFATTPQGLPGSSADLSTRAVPNHPGRSDGCLCLLLHHRSVWLHPSRADWPPSYSYRGRIGFTCVTARVFASQVRQPHCWNSRSLG